MGRKREVFECDGKRITPREAEVLLCCARGLTSRETADRLFISCRTVERHRENLRERLGLIGPHMLTNWAVRMQPQLEKWVKLPIDNMQ